MGCIKSDIPEGPEVELCGRELCAGSVAQTSVGAGSVAVIAKGGSVGEMINQEESETCRHKRQRRKSCGTWCRPKKKNQGILREE